MAKEAGGGAIEESSVGAKDELQRARHRASTVPTLIVEKVSESRTVIHCATGKCFLRRKVRWCVAEDGKAEVDCFDRSNR